MYKFSQIYSGREVAVYILVFNSVLLFQYKL